MVVFPAPGDPQRTKDGRRGAPTNRASGAPGASRCRWPTTSSSRVGRNRSASGPDTAISASVAAANRSTGTGRGYAARRRRSDRRDGGSTSHARGAGAGTAEVVVLATLPTLGNGERHLPADPPRRRRRRGRQAAHGRQARPQRGHRPRLSDEATDVSPVSPTEALFREEGVPVSDELRQGLVGGEPVEAPKPNPIQATVGVLRPARPAPPGSTVGAPPTGGDHRRRPASRTLRPAPTSPTCAPASRCRATSRRSP